MPNIKIPAHLLPDYIEHLRWEARKRDALIDLANRKVDPHIHWEGLLEHYKTLFHEDIPTDIEFRRFFDELKTVSEEGYFTGRKFVDVSSDMAKVVQQIQSNNVE